MAKIAKGLKAKVQRRPKKRKWISMNQAVAAVVLREVRTFAIVPSHLNDVSYELRCCVGLRQAPPQRVLFQPDVSSSRQPRHSSSHHHHVSPQPNSGMNNYSNSLTTQSNNLPLNIANYEPKHQIPLTLRGVITPGNNPSLFKEKQRMAREAKAMQAGRASSLIAKGMMKPGGKLVFSLPRS